MFPYIAIYICSGMLAFCYSKSKDKSASVVFLVSTFLALFLPAAVRYNIGTDYKNYVQIISASLPKHRYAVFETGWMPILWLLDNFNLNIHFFFVLTDFAILLCLFFVLDKKSFYLCIPIYVCFAYIQSFSLVRQSLAATIFLIAVKQWIKRNYVSAIFWSVFSFLFHKSTVFLCVLLLFANLRWSIFSRKNNVIFFILIYLFVDSLSLGTIIMDKVVGNTFYAAYLTGTFNKATEGRGFGILLREILLFIAVIASSRTVNKMNSSNTLIASAQNRLYNVSVLFNFAGIAFFILSTQIHIFNRLPCLIIPFLVITIQCVYRSECRYRKTVLLLLETGWFLSFIFYIKSSLISNSGGLGITPYQTLFSR